MAQSDNLICLIWFRVMRLTLQFCCLGSVSQVVVLHEVCDMVDVLSGVFLLYSSHRLIDDQTRAAICHESKTSVLIRFYNNVPRNEGVVEMC